MTNFQSDWVFNLILKLAVIVCLGTLALGLIVGVAPLIALLRSSAAFFTFALLGWATALVWQTPELETTGVQSEESFSETNQPSPATKQTADGQLPTASEKE